MKSIYIFIYIFLMSSSAMSSAKLQRIKYFYFLFADEVVNEVKDLKVGDIEIGAVVLRNYDKEKISFIEDNQSSSLSIIKENNIQINAYKWNQLLHEGFDLRPHILEDLIKPSFPDQAWEMANSLYVRLSQGNNNFNFLYCDLSVSKYERVKKFSRRKTVKFKSSGSIQSNRGSIIVNGTIATGQAADNLRKWGIGTSEERSPEDRGQSLAKSALSKCKKSGYDNYITIGYAYGGFMYSEGNFGSSGGLQYEQDVKCWKWSTEKKSRQKLKAEKIAKAKVCKERLDMKPDHVIVSNDYLEFLEILDE